MQPQKATLSKKVRREIRKQKLNSGMIIRDIYPLTDNQQLAFDQWAEEKDLFIHGSAGTGKTLIAFYLALKEVEKGNAKKVIVIRSTVPSRDMGFLPGTIKEKTMMFESPYYDICNTIFGRGDAYEVLKNKGTIDFITTSHIRGITFDDAIIIVDEAQNLAWHELNTVMSRIGNRSRFIFAGDTKQTDLDERSGKFDLNKMIAVIKRMTSFVLIQMLPDDVVRSGKAKQYIVACEQLGF